MTERKASWCANIGVVLIGVGCYMIHPALGLIMAGCLLILAAVYSDIQ